MLDEELLEALDQDEVVRRLGRSAVIRRMTAEYLARCENRAVSAQYEQANGYTDGLGTEFEGWEEQGEWPND